ncbi:GNAT family N-acetyltransferase [archaeon]|nr:GNAT family N-acetyltransferase [archaeon]|tara:strand:+ start:1563 stop:2072 length:510 start_codon:yes stop_codon:yes gene_type:complete
MIKSPKVTLRYQQIKDAKRFFKIFQSPNFTYFNVRVKTVEEEREFLRKNKEKRKNNSEHNFSIIYKKKLVGAVGISIQRRSYIGEIGYFIDEKYWRKGIATAAVKLVEEIALKKLKIRRLEIYCHPKNVGSRKVAEKSGYKKQAILKKYYDRGNGNLENSVLYAKIIDN